MGQKGWVVGPPRSGGMEAVLWLPAKQQVRGPQPSPGTCLMQIPASESLLFFSLTEEANSGWIWRNSQTHVLMTEWACLVGVAPGISVLSGEATLLHSSGEIPCACSELWWNYLA